MGSAAQSVAERDANAHRSDAATPSASAVALSDGLSDAGHVRDGAVLRAACTIDGRLRFTSRSTSRAGGPESPQAAVWIDENAASGGAAVGVGFGADLPRDPCVTEDLIDTGSTVDGFAERDRAHRVLDATDPVDVSLDGYSGKYIDLQLPADLSTCKEFRPWEPGIYAQGPDHQWHLWILDVDGYPSRGRVHGLSGNLGAASSGAAGDGGVHPDRTLTAPGSSGVRRSTR